MKLFICWSGNWGENSALLIKTWLYENVFKSVLTADDIVVSKDIAKGSIWFDELNRVIDDSTAALVCLTEEALRSPWVNYEVGAIAHALRSKSDEPACRGLAPIFTLLLGVDVAEITGPLSAFQSTSVEDEKDMRQLIDGLIGVFRMNRDSINAMLDENWRSIHGSLSDQLKSMKMPVPEAFPAFDRLSRSRRSTALTRGGLSDTMLPATRG